MGIVRNFRPFMEDAASMSLPVNTIEDDSQSTWESLDSYHSYELQWLGPILYPLSLAIIAQALVFVDIVQSHKGRRFLPQLWYSAQGNRTSKASTFKPMDHRINLVAAIIMIAEVVFAVCCLVQCIINYHSRAFVGTRTACDVQAAYATYYVFSAIGLAAYGILVGWRVIATGGQCHFFRARALIGSGLLIHFIAAFIALLPLFGVDGWMFATDYCMFHIEAPVYCTLFLTFFSASAVTILIALRKASVFAEGASSKRHAYKLLLVSAGYLCVAWLTTCVIAFLWIFNGTVYDSSQWRIYGAQAIILHSNQLFTPLLFGWFWRHAMQSVISQSDSSAIMPST